MNSFHDQPEFQKKNCPGCWFAVKEKIGTGESCCTYPYPVRMEGDVCVSYRLGRQCIQCGRKFISSDGRHRKCWMCQGYAESPNELTKVFEEDGKECV